MDLPEALLKVVETAAGLEVVKQVAKQAQDFIAAATGHPGESIGTILGNLVDRRAKNAETVASKAYLTLLNIGVKVGEVKLPILFPILEAASLQEDSYMQDTWANLLANASDSRKIDAVHPSFPTILKDLGPREVKFLDALFKDAVPRRKFGVEDVIYDLVELKKIELVADGIDVTRTTIGVDTDFVVMIEILARNRLLTPHVETNPASSPRYPSINGKFSLSQVGVAFIVVCQRPST